MNSKQLSLGALSLGFFMVIIDVTIINVALPSMAKSLSGGIAWLQWVVDGYTLTFACLLLSAGSLTDRLGAKTAFLVGLILFVLTSAGCGIATSFWMLTFFRLLQGVGAGLIVPTSLALINASYDNVQERAKAIGIWASIGGVAAALGPILGAMLTTWFSWRAVFFVNVPVGLLAVLLTIYSVPPTPKMHKGSFDWIGQSLGIMSIAALSFGLIEAGRLGWSSAIVISSFIIFLIMTILFLLIEARTSDPMLPLQLFKSKIFSVTVSLGMILNLGFYGILFTLPLYFQQIRGYSILMTGLAITPIAALTAIGSYLGGKITSAYGPRLPILMGFSIAGVAFFLMLIVEAHTPSYFVLLLPLAAIGFGGSMTQPAATSATMHAAPHENAGIAAGTFNTSRQIGSLLGVAIFGTIVNTATHFMTGMHITLIIAGLAYLGGFLLAAFYIKNS